MCLNDNIALDIALQYPIAQSIPSQGPLYHDLAIKAALSETMFSEFCLTLSCDLFLEDSDSRVRQMPISMALADGLCLAERKPNFLPTVEALFP